MVARVQDMEAQSAWEAELVMVRDLVAWVWSMGTVDMDGGGGMDDRSGMGDRVGMGDWRCCIGSGVDMSGVDMMATGIGACAGMEDEKCGVRL